LNKYIKFVEFVSPDLYNYFIHYKDAAALNHLFIFNMKYNIFGMPNFWNYFFYPKYSLPDQEKKKSSKKEEALCKAYGTFHKYFFHVIQD